MPEDEVARHDAALFGVSAEFTTPEALVDAAWAMRAHGLNRLEAYSPMPVAGLREALPLAAPPIARLAVIVALAGGLGFTGMMVYATGYDYVFNIGGRPRLSWPAFVIPSVSVGMLAAAIAVFLMLLFLNRLPRLNHPVFNIDGFERASQDRYFLCVEAESDGFDPAEVERHLADLHDGPVAIQKVPR